MDRHKPGHCLLLEPFAGVARIDSGMVGKLRDRPRTPKRSIQLEPPAYMDRLQFEGTDGGTNQSIFEGLFGGRCHLRVPFREYG